VVKREGKLNGAAARIESGATEGLILSGDLIAQRAQGRARVDKGRMKRSITRGNPYTTARGRAISVGSNLDYFPAHEFGSGDKSENPSMSKDPSRPGITAQPMVRPAIKESKREAAVLVAKRILSKMVRR
jgi:phage gpG-like protein